MLQYYTYDTSYDRLAFGTLGLSDEDIAQAGMITESDFEYLEQLGEKGIIEEAAGSYGFNPFAWLTKVFDMVFKFIKKFWVVIILVAAVIIAIYFPATWALIISYISEFGAWLSTLSFTQLFGLGLAVATILNPEEVGKGLSHVAQGAGKGVGSVVKSITDSVLSHPLGAALVIGVLYTILKDDDDGDRLWYVEPASRIPEEGQSRDYSEIGGEMEA